MVIGASHPKLYFLAFAKFAQNVHNLFPIGDGFTVDGGNNVAGFEPGFLSAEPGTNLVNARGGSGDVELNAYVGTRWADAAGQRADDSNRMRSFRDPGRNCPLANRQLFIGPANRFE